MNYYNDIDKGACDWLRQLIDDGLIPDGVVDPRSITDIQPDELQRFAQCHFFAGVGGWPLALRLAGLPDSVRVWTGSCPCQPFSCAGNRKGTSDHRHLWPEFARLIRECKPQVVFGEQVCSVAVTGTQSPKGRGVSAPLQIQESGEGFDEARTTESFQEEATIRPGSAFTGVAGTYRQRLMRDFWPSVQPGWWENMGQPIIRQDQSQARLQLHERSGHNQRSEQCAWGLGGSEDAGNSQGDNGSQVERLKLALRIARSELDEETLNLWLTGVRLDLEEVGYSVGACVLPAAGLGAPHIRQRLYWVAHSASSRHSQAGHRPELRVERSRERLSGNGCGEGRVAAGQGQRRGEARGRGTGPAQRVGDGGEADRMADAEHAKRGQERDGCGCDRQDARRDEAHGQPGSCRQVRGVANCGQPGLEGHAGDVTDGHQPGRVGAIKARPTTEGRAPRHWADSRWHECIDGKLRRVPIESIFQLESDGLSSIMGSGWDSFLAEVAKQVDIYAEKANSRPGEVLRAMWESVAEKSLRENAGGHDAIQKQKVLLVALCELARNPGRVVHAAAQTVGEIQEATLRIVRGYPSEIPIARPSHQRELEGSPTGKPSDTLRQMPPSNSPPQEAGEALQGVRTEGEKTFYVSEALSAMEEVWKSNDDKDSSPWNAERLQTGVRIIEATGCFPLAQNIPGRSVLLRGAGNAIVPQVAAEFVMAWMET